MSKRQAYPSTSERPCWESLIQNCWGLAPRRWSVPPTVPHPTFSQPWLQCPACRSSSGACPCSAVSFGSSLVGAGWCGIDDSWLGCSSTRTLGRLWSHQSWAEIFWNATSQWEKVAEAWGVGVRETLPRKCTWRGRRHHQTRVVRNVFYSHLLPSQPHLLFHFCRFFLIEG